MTRPQSPESYGEGMSDEELAEGGWAAGLEVWDAIEKVYGNFVGSEMANSQLWSLREAVRREAFAEVARELHERIGNHLVEKYDFCQDVGHYDFPCPVGEALIWLDGQVKSK